MSAHADPPLNPLSVSIDQFRHDAADVFVNGVNLAGNIRKDSISIDRVPDTGLVALTLTFLVDDFQHKGPMRAEQFKPGGIVTGPVTIQANVADFIKGTRRAKGGEAGR